MTHERTLQIYNIDVLNFEALTEGGMPIMAPETYMPGELFSFNFVKSMNGPAPKSSAVHFFIDDYQFERTWNSPKVYAEMLSEFEAVLTPDFSLYLDMPEPMKRWNVYRSRALGQYWQSRGLRVIPTVSWAGPETFDWCFDGLPSGGVLALSNVGTRRNPDARKVWMDGVDELLARCEPSQLLVYGEVIDRDWGSARPKFFANQQFVRMRSGKKWVEPTD